MTALDAVALGVDEHLGAAGVRNARDAGLRIDPVDAGGDIRKLEGALRKRRRPLAAVVDGDLRAWERAAVRSNDFADDRAGRRSAASGAAVVGPAAAASAAGQKHCKEAEGE